MKALQNGSSKYIGSNRNLNLFDIFQPIAYAKYYKNKKMKIFEKVVDKRKMQWLYIQVRCGKNERQSESDVLGERTIWGQVTRT